MNSEPGPSQLAVARVCRRSGPDPTSPTEKEKWCTTTSIDRPIAVAGKHLQALTCTGTQRIGPVCSNSVKDIPSVTRTWLSNHRRRGRTTRSITQNLSPLAPMQLQSDSRRSKRSDPPSRLRNLQRPQQRFPKPDLPHVVPSAHHRASRGRLIRRPPFSLNPLRNKKNPRGRGADQQPQPPETTLRTPSTCQNSPACVVLGQGQVRRL